MKEQKINGIQIKLPYEPYKAQEMAITDLLRSFETGGSALIESPTGTGKSLSILCAALGYLEHIKRKLGDDVAKRSVTKELEKLVAPEDEIKQSTPKIFICSRTHKQIDQLIEQLRKTDYKPTIAILGSRKQYCVNSSIKNAVDINTACREKVSKKACHYRNGVGKLKKKIEEIYDIEQIKTLGKKCAGCPYFASRELAEDADIVFAPYNYLIDPHVRSSLDIKLKNSIVIIDEAHNVEDTCRSSGSFEFSSKNIEMWTIELTTAARKAALLENFKGDFLFLIEFLKLFKICAEKIKPTEKNFDYRYKIYKGEQIRELLVQAGIDENKLGMFYSTKMKVDKDENAKTLMSQNLSQSLDAIGFILKLVFSEGCKQYVLCFKDFVKEKKYEFCYWLLDPSIIFNSIVRQANSVSLLSGTLSPFTSFDSELKHNFKYKTIAPHILKSEQVFISNVQAGHLNKPLTGTYAISESFEYLDQIARMIEDIANKVKDHGGTLVFVPSYNFLKKLYNRMKIDCITEPQTGGNEKFDEILKEYKKCIEDKNRPAIMLCVYRGKASEGIDFRDEYARAVIAVGIPYPSVKDPQIQVKKDFNNKNTQFNGSAWYSTQALRAVNQALGRIVRHPKDWGVIYLLETRYSQNYIRKQLPEWITNNMKGYQTYKESENDFNQFIKTKEKASDEIENILIVD